MARDHASAPSGPETFQQLKALLGRLPTVDELSRELVPAPGRRRPGRRFMVVGAIGLSLVVTVFFVGSQLDLQEWLSADAAVREGIVPELPSAPAVEAAAPPPALPAIVPPPPAAIEQTPTRRTVPAPVPAREKTRSLAQRRAAATTPRVAPKPPAPLAVEDTAAIQQRVLPDPSARAQRTITGRIKISVRVSVDPSGNVTDARSLSPEASKYFNGLAVKAARAWRFAPAAPDGGDTAREWVLRFEFARQDTSAAAVPATP